MTALKGFFHPRSATGNSSLVPAPPWHYSGDLLSVEYRTDPARVAELLPGPLEPAAEDPDVVTVVWAYWQSCSAGGAELLDPVRAQYQETLVLVRCSYGGETFHRCVFIWVDKQFAAARGFLQGYHKKFGSCYMTRPYLYGRAAPRIAAGGRFGGTLAAGDRRLCEAVVTLRAEREPTRFAFGSLPLLHSRWVPAIDTGGGLALDELVRTGAAEAELGPFWWGDAQLRLHESPTEDLARLAVREVLGGSFCQAGMTWAGGTVIHPSRKEPTS